MNNVFGTNKEKLIFMFLFLTKIRLGNNQPIAALPVQAEMTAGRAEVMTKHVTRKHLRNWVCDFHIYN